MNKPLALALFLYLVVPILFVIGAWADCKDEPDAAPPPLDYAECRDQAYARRSSLGDDPHANRHLRSDLESCRYAFPDTAPELPEGLLRGR